MKIRLFDFGAVLFQWQPYRLLQECLPELAPDEDSARRVAAQIFESFTPDSDWATVRPGPYRRSRAGRAHRRAHRRGSGTGAPRDRRHPADTCSHSRPRWRC
jgi:hypothetical protein